MKLTLTHIVFTILTLAATLAPGFIAARRIRTADDFSVGGRRSGSFLVAGSIIGTIVGGAATIGTAQLGSIIGLTAWWFTLGSGLALLIMAFLYAVPLRKSGLTTVSEFLVLSYGRKAGWLASVSSSFGIFFSIVASTLTGLHMIAAIFGLDLYTSGVLLVAVTSCFVFSGGMRGGGMAGLLKTVLVFASIAVGGGMAFSSMGGLQGMHEVLPDFPWFSMLGRGLDDALYSLGSVIVGVLSTQSYVQSVFSARDARSAAIGCAAAAAVVIPVGLPAVMIGMYMHAAHPEVPAITALPVFLLTFLPEWLGGIGIGALLLSVIGSIGGLSLGTATLIARDVVGSVWRGIDGRQALWVNRLLVVASMAAALVFVFFHLDSAVLDYNYLSMALRASGIFLPLSFCIFLPGRIAPAWGVASIACGVLTACLWPFFGPEGVSSLYPALAVNMVPLAVGLAVGPGKGK